MEKVNYFISRPGVLVILREGGEGVNPSSLPAEVHPHPGPLLIIPGCVMDMDAGFLAMNPQFTEIRTSFISGSASDLILSRAGMTVLAKSVSTWKNLTELLEFLCFEAKAKFDFSVFVGCTSESDRAEFIEGLREFDLLRRVDKTSVRVSNMCGGEMRIERAKLVDGILSETADLLVLDTIDRERERTKFSRHRQVSVIHSHYGGNPVECHSEEYYAILGRCPPGFGQFGAIKFCRSLPAYDHLLEKRRADNQQTSTLALLSVGVSRLGVGAPVRRLGPLLREVAEFL